ncbi:glycosyltransferase family 39 protein [bacterium]|nr:glycosyltransferase family 39 protein [bacterium]
MTREPTASRCRWAEAGGRALDSRAFLPICFAVALLLRVAWVATHDPYPAADYKWYWNAARSIAAGHGFTAQGLPTARWPVGYPAFLGGLFALTGPSLVVGRVANIVLYLGIILLATVLARRMLASERAARLAALILAIYPNHIYHASLLLSEIFFTFLLLLGVVLLTTLRRRVGWTAVAGLVFGYATLTKPQALLIPALVIGVSLLRNLSWRGALGHAGLLVAATVPMAAVIAPWTMRNHRVFGRPFLVSTNGAYNLLVGNNPHARGRSKFDRKVAAYARLWGRRHGPKREVFHHDRASAAAWKFIREHPGRVVALWPRKLFYAYRSDWEGIGWHAKCEERRLEEAAGIAKDEGSSGDDADEDGSKYRPHKAVAMAVYVLVLIGMLRTVWVGFIRRRKQTAAALPWASLGLWLTLYFSLIVLAFFGSPRFHFPLIPFFAIYAAAAATGRVTGDP